jgi:hypothetical protein
MKKLSYFLMAAVVVMFTACITPDVNNGGGNDGGTPIPEPTPELAVNTFSINDVVGEFKSVALAQMEEYIYLVATPTADLASADDIFGADEFVYVLVGPQLVGKEFDLMTEQNTYTIMSYLAGAVLEGVAPGATYEISAGKASFVIENNVATAKADITLANGAVLKLHLSAEQQVVVNENTIARGDEEKPLRAAFYMVDEEATTLYFTPGNIDYFTGVFGVQMISYDKVNQLRHVKYLKDKAHTLEIMKRHATVMGPKFRCVADILDREIKPLGIAEWKRPTGGYFISLNAMPGTAKRVWNLCKEAGVTMTNAGATFPYGKDPNDSNIRIAPSLPPVAELEQAMEVFTTSLKLAALEKLLNK